MPAPHPCEYDPAIFATVEAATANGVHVYAAAGNGGQNLDSAAYGGALALSVLATLNVVFRMSESLEFVADKGVAKEDESLEAGKLPGRSRNYLCLHRPNNFKERIFHL